MKRSPLISTLTILVAGVVVLTIAVTRGSASQRKPASGAALSAVSVKHTSLGNIVVDTKGHTLYLFKADRPNRSTLSREGFAVWPAFAPAGKPQAKGGISAAHIATIKSDGKRQVTYFGHPLYYYVGDKSSGQTNGQGLKQFGALWYVLSPKGTAVTSAPAPAPTESSGYRY